MEWMLLLIALLYIGASGFLWLYAPINIAAFLCILQGVFYLLPSALYFLLRPEYQLEAFTILKSPLVSQVELDMTLVPILLSICMFAGASIGWFAANKTSRATVPYVGTNVSPRIREPLKAFSTTAAVAFAVPIAIVLVYLVGREGNTLEMLLLPFRKNKVDVYGSYYILQFVTTWPLIVALVSVTYYRRYAALFAGAMIVVACLLSFGTGQRIRLVSIILTLVFWWLWTRWRGGWSVRAGAAPADLPNTRAIRTKIVSLVAGVSVFVPVLWWARNVANQLERTGRIIDSPINSAGFLSTFFGSPASGLPTLNAVCKFIELKGFQYGYIFRDIVVSPIPRALWPDKPPVMDVRLVETLELNTSPSIFLVNELWLAFGLLSFLITTALFFALSYSCNISYKSLSSCVKVCMVLFGGFSIIMFKNGIVLFTINYGFSVALFAVALLVMRLGEALSKALGRSIGRLHERSSL